MLSKCSAFGEKDDVAQIEKNSCMFGESGFSKSSPTVYLCTTFWYCNRIEILLATSLVLGKNKGKLQSCLLDLPYRKKLKHQWQLYTCMLPKRLPSQNSRVQIANLCHKFQFVILFNLRCLVNFHFTWWSSLERKTIKWEMGKDTPNMEVSKRSNTNE